MVLFVVLGLMTVAALALLVAPLLRRYGDAAPRSAYDLQIYRDQLRELDHDVERGLITDEQQATARAEIERRMLTAVPQQEKAPAQAEPIVVVAFVIVAALPIVAGSLYLWLGAPGLDGRPIAARERATPPAPIDHPESVDIAAMVERLAARLESQPDDLDGWLMLGRSYGVLERYDDAVVALKRAVALSNGHPDVLAMLAEYQVFAADGIVTPATVKNFESALAKNPKQPGARFYLALARVQAGDLQGALDRWQALARDSPPDATWLPAVRAQIDAVAADLGIDTAVALAGVPTPSAPTTPPPGPTREDIDDAAQMSAGDRMEMIRGMVARLAERLEGSPGDLAGWRRLGRSYRVLGEAARARDAFARAAALDPDDPALLQDYAAAIVEAAPDGALLPQEAVVVFRRVAELDRDNTAALWHLGLADAESGNTAGARALWRRLLALLPSDSPDRPAVERAIDRLGEALSGG